MVVAEVRAKDPAKVSLIEHDNVIRAVLPDRTDHAFDEGILPRRARYSDGFLGSQTIDPSFHRSTVGAISILYRVTGCGIKRKRFDDLLGGPLSHGMLRHVEVNDLATFMAENDKRVEHAKGGGRDSEEIDGDKVRDMAFKKGPPRLRWQSSIKRQIPRDRGLRDLNAQFKQLSVNPWSAPYGIRRLHVTDELADSHINGRSTYDSLMTFRTLVTAKACTMPMHNGNRVQGMQHCQPSIDVTLEKNPRQPVNRRDARILHRKLEHRELLAKCQILKRQMGGVTGVQSKSFSKKGKSSPRPVVTGRFGILLNVSSLIFLSSPVWGPLPPLNPFGTSTAASQSDTASPC